MSDIKVTVTSAGSSGVTTTAGDTYNAAVGNGGSVAVTVGGVAGSTPTLVSGTVEVGTVTTLAAGSTATVTNSGTGYHAILDFGIPQGMAGITPAFSIGTVTTGAAGSSASVTATTTDGGSKVSLDFAIPRGADGTGSGVSLSNATPSALGTASAGTSTSASRADHVHALPTAKDLGLATVATSGSYADLTGTPEAYTLPTASPSTLGGIKVGSGLTISSGVLSAVEGINWVAAPASSTATGTAGSVAYDSSYLYVAVSTNTWKRTLLSSWTGDGGGYGTFTPTAVILTSGTTYAAPSGATSVKAWAIGPGSPYITGMTNPGHGGGVAYKTWSITGGQSITYAIGSPGYQDGASFFPGGDSSVTVSGTTITARAGDYVFSPGGYSVPSGDGGADGTASSGGRGGPIGAGSFPSGTCRASAGDVSGLLSAVALAGGKAIEDCGSQPAFGSGGNGSLSPGRGGGAGEYGSPVGGAVVLYFT